LDEKRSLCVLSLLWWPRGNVYCSA